MNAQVVTPQLRQWIVEQARAGCRPDEVLMAMRSSGWDADVAAQALDDTLARFLVDSGRPDQLPPAVPVPGVDLGGALSVRRAHDREVTLVMAMHNPRIVVFASLLSDDECDALIAAAAPRMTRSETVVLDTGGNEVNPARTSEGMFFERGETPLCTLIEARIAALLNWPVVNGEGLQVLHYRSGAEYKPHHDYFDPALPGMTAVLARGGQRVATVVIYLNTPERGGGTIFPDVPMEVAPIKGHAVFFSYDRPHAVTRTLHGGAPVLAGDKWVATKWLREREFV
jgi:prolyl 4-hydroxylase